MPTGYQYIAAGWLSSHAAAKKTATTAATARCPPVGAHQARNIHTAAIASASQPNRPRSRPQYHSNG